MGFVVFALPRSRTFWLSKFLSHGGWHCGHDEAVRMRTMGDVKTWFSQPNTGTVETAVAPWWRLIHRIDPTLKIVVIRRPVPEVVESILACGLAQDREAVTAAMTQMDHKLDQIERRLDCVSFRFDELNDETACAGLYEYCTGQSHDHDWWASLAEVNLQIDVPALLRYCAAYRPQLAKMAAIATQTIKADLMLREPPDMVGVTFQQEPFDKWYAEAQNLFANHCISVDESPDEFSRKNVPLGKRVDDMGRMQIITARSNGRMFGYLVSLLSPSLEAVDRFTGVHTMFYASPELPGLGLKLQRESVRRLREKGVNEIFWRAGVRGDGPRMEALYRRLGGEYCGRVFRLDLTGE